METTLSRRTLFTVLPFALPPLERRVLNAALKLSAERHRLLRYRLHTPCIGRPPDVVITSARTGDEPLTELLTRHYGHGDPDSLPVIALAGGACAEQRLRRHHSPTPFELLGWLDRVALGAHPRMRSSIMLRVRTGAPGINPT